MPERILNSGEDAVGPVVGFFGKLPVTGDFLSRGLPDGFRGTWDAWVTRHVAPRLSGGIGGWPEGGLRLRLVSGGRVAAGVILPSEDSAGRRFPLTLLVIAGALPEPSELDPWCDAAEATGQAAINGPWTADDLWDALGDMPVPEGADPAAAPLTLWTADLPPEAADPSDPGPFLDRALPPSG